MTPSPDPQDEPGLKLRRESVRRAMLRTNAALAAILAAVLALALVAVLAGVRAARDQRRAQDAESQARERLWHSYLAQAHANRLTEQMGRRADALAAVSGAVAIRPALELRNEAIASLALLDAKDRGISLPPTEPSVAEFDQALTRYAFADADRKIHVRLVADQSELFVLDVNTVVPKEGGPVQMILLSEDGRFLGARCRGGAVVIWNLEDQQVRVLAAKNSTNRTLGALLFESNASRVSFANADRDGQISVFDLATGKETGFIDIKAGARYFRFKPGDTNVIAIATDNEVALTEISSRKPLAKLVHSSRVSFFRWSKSGEHLFVACTSGEVYDWNVARQSFRVLSGHGEGCISLLESRDGEMLLTGSRDGTSRFWNLRTGRPMLEATRGIALQLDASGPRAVYWQPGIGYGLWEIQRSEILSAHSTDSNDGVLLTTDLSLDGRWCVGTQNKGFKLWNLETGFNKFYVVSNLNSVRFAIDSQALLLCRDSGLELWPLEFSTATGRAEVRFGVTQKIATPGSNGVHAIALSRDGRTLAVESGNLAMSVIDLRGERAPVVWTEKPTSRWIRGPGSATGAGRFVVSPDGRWLVDGVRFGKRPVVFDTKNGERVRELDSNGGMAAFNKDGRQLIIATPTSYDIYETRSWSRTQTLPRDKISTTYGSVAMAGSLAAITPTRQSIRLVDLESGKTLADLKSPGRQTVNSLRLSEDGQTLAAAMADDSVHVWNLKLLRTQLAALNLDWLQNHGGALAQITTAPQKSSWHLLLVLGLVPVAVAAVAGALVLGRHRTIVREYLATEALSEQRNRQLETAKVELLHGQKMRALGTLAAGIAHDFNNLLSVIRMSNKLVGRETKDNAEVQENVAEIEQAVLQGKNVVGSMLGYSRNEDGAGGPTDVNAVVENVVSLLSKQFLSGITLTLELDRNAPMVKLGRGHLEQVLLNLVVNASEAMQGNGKLKISVHKRTAIPAKPYVLRPGEAEQFVEFSVKDSGPGIAPELRDRLFEPFFTTKHSGSKVGTGLGLSLVYSIAEQESLGLSVESEPGKGAMFSLMIPVAPISVPVRQTHSSQSKSPP